MNSGRRLAQELFEEEGLDTIFAHVRNLVVASLIVAAGVFAARESDKSQLLSIADAAYIGYGAALVGVLLLLLNLVDGLRRLARRRHHIVLRAVLIAIYVILSVRLAQLLFIFRNI
jgi:hypothetical protein